MPTPSRLSFRVVAGPDAGSQPVGKALVLGDDRLLEGAAPGGPAAEPLGYDVIGAVEGAEADRAPTKITSSCREFAGRSQTA